MKKLLKVITKSERGLVREENEDNLLVLEDAGLYAVADGMGGGEEGARASRMVCETLKACTFTDDFASRIEALKKAIQDANAKILAYARANHFKQMGSTIALILFDFTKRNRAAVIHVGDSRVYRLRDGRAEQLTRDHSLGAELEAKVSAEGIGGRFSARSNPLAHILTRSIGPEAKVVPDCSEIDVKKGDRFVICSDGVHDVIENAEFATLFSGERDDALGRSECEILHRGAPDNYSFVLIDVED